VRLANPHEDIGNEVLDLFAVYPLDHAGVNLTDPPAASPFQAGQVER
jgi:hypothetical protein